jgi:hypothetical protein
VKAVDLGRFNGAPEIQKEIVSKRRNTMNKGKKKYEPYPRATELSEKSLDEVAGGGISVGSKEMEMKKKAQAPPQQPQAADLSMMKAAR